ncbi:MAG: MEDS domain-containing protein [Nitrosopumilus sp.]|nr:MEDS domain-containing protein [Nitrosopumilus sp.]
MEVQEFLESQKHEHIVLIHEELTIGNSIEIKFIKEGLGKGHVCLYITNDVTTTKTHMEEIGVNVSQFEKENLLHIIEIPKTFSEYKKNILEIVNDIEKYRKDIRVVSTHHFDFSINDNVNSMIEIEQKIDDVFSKVPGTMICSFSLNKMGQNQSKEFITKLLDSHHKVIFLQKDGTSKWFNLP